MSTETANVESTQAALFRSREAVSSALNLYNATSKGLRDTIVSVRARGVVTVKQMAEALGTDRNYVDQVWSTHGRKDDGSWVTRGDVHELVDDLKSLANANASFRAASNALNTARAERNRVISLAYASKVLGPSEIANAVGIDRNHVQRIARKAGIKPLHRSNPRNQYTVNKTSDQD